MLPCVHRGGPTGDDAACAACGGIAYAPLYVCRVRGRCATDLPPAGGIAFCPACPDRDPGTVDTARPDPAD